MDDKRFYRELKRDIKKDGNRNRRNFLKRQLRANPEEAHWDEYTFNYDSSEWLNNMFPDHLPYPDEEQDRY